MLKFFNVHIDYKKTQINYVEPAKDSNNILLNIIKYELFLTDNNQQVLKYFKIIQK